MNILVACEESQSVTIEMRKLGHRAFSCDLIECSGGHPEWHIIGDCEHLINGSVMFQTMDGNLHMQQKAWDMIIAHPPCTYLTSAGSMWMFRFDVNGEKWINADRYGKMREAVRFFMRILQADCERICVENPAPMHICELPAYDQIIEPYMFGHPYKKRTCLWLQGLPMLRETDRVQPKFVWVDTGKGKLNRTKIGADKSRNARERSKTFPGIARAMAEQWAGRCEE